MAMFKKIAHAPRTLRVLAHLLSYPNAELRQHMGELRSALHTEQALSEQRLAELDVLMLNLERGDLLELQSQYVDLFDRGRATALHLFEHVHGDSRDRGPAMIDLAQTYEKANLYLAADELPDYLPVVLQFASTQPAQEARDFLAEMAHILNAIFNALQKRGSGYACVLGALLELAGEQAHAVNIQPDEGLDAAWEEPVVFDGCSSKGQARADATIQPIHFVKNAAAGAQAQPARAGVSL